MRVLAAAIVLASAALAHAQADEALLGGPIPNDIDSTDPTGGTATEAEWHGTPQNFALELKFGPYMPDVDSEFTNGNTPYRDTFGDDLLVLGLFEFDWEFYRIMAGGSSVGSFAVGLSSGFMQAVGPGKTADGRTSGESTVLNIVPLYYTAVFRFDMLAERWGVPLVPYVKAGFTTYVWWILNGGGTAQSGWSPGWHFSPGILFQLDVLEPGAARSFDSSIGINHSYLMFEMLWVGADGFGRGKSMVLSDLSWTAGVAFEF